MVRLFRAFVLTVSLGLVGSDGSLAAAEVPVAISVWAKVEGEILRIRGTATVPDGAWIAYAAYRVAEPQMRATGYARVEAGRFAAQVNVAHWPPGEIAVDAHFQMLVPGRTQPDAAAARYGPKGERMTGDDVVEGGASYRAAVASTAAVKPR